MLLMMEAPLRISSQAIKYQVMGKRLGGWEQVLEISDVLDYFSHT